MANEQKVKVTVGVPYMDQNGMKKIRACVLSLSTQDMAAIGAEGSGEVSIQGAVMPVGSTDPGLKTLGATLDSGSGAAIAA